MKHSLKALQVTRPGTSEIVELPKPEPAENEALIKVEAVSTCPHWDRHIFEGRPMFAGMKLEYPYWPGQPGHEAIGTVEAVGSHVREDWLGKRVAIWRDAGPYRNGLYATHGIVPAENMIAIPADMPRERITSLELAMCVQVSIDQLAEVEAIQGRKLAVSGLGPAGLIAIQLLKHAGAAEIIAIDPQENRRDLAKQLGADQCISPDDPGLPASRMEAGAFHASLDTTGLPVSIEKLMGCSRRAVAIFGVLRDSLQFGPAQWYGGFSLIGYGEHNRAAADRAFEAIKTGALDMSPLISRTMSMEAYPEAVAELQSLGAIKILLLPPEG